MHKRVYEENCSPSKYQRLEPSPCNVNTYRNLPTLLLDARETQQDIESTDDSPTIIAKKSLTHDETNTNINTFIDNFFNEPYYQMEEDSTNVSDCVEPQPTILIANTHDDYNSNLKDYTEMLLKNLNFQNVEYCLTSPPVTTLGENVSEPTITTHKINTSNKTLSTSIKTRRYDSSSRNLILFEKELGNFIFLALIFHNRQYYVNIKDVSAKKNGISMDIPSWYEFQYKILAFNLKYKSSSFVADNNILVLNCNNSTMHIKNLKNYHHIDLTDNQLEKLKEVAYDLNDKLIHHMFSKQLPYLIKCKCILSNLSPKKELMLMSKLIFAIEGNLLTILNRIYECHACVSMQQSQALHPCFLFNNREKFQQFGNRLLMLVNLDFVSHVFSNGIDFISDQFLDSMNVQTITDVVFKALK